jgi:enoyl-CoA hydratase
MTYVIVEVADRIATVTLNDPDRRNAINATMNAELLTAFDDLESRDDIGAVVLTGAGKGFCAGADLELLRAAKSADAMHAIYAGFLRVANSTLPTVAAVNGAAVGAGMNMVLACDIAIASEAATFDARFLDIGLHPGGGHAWRLRRNTNQQTVMAMVLFGQKLTGAQAAARQVVWDCVPADALLATASSIAGRAANFPPELTRKTKQTILGLGSIFEAADAVDGELTPQLWSMAEPPFQDLLARLQTDISKG